MNKFYKIIFLSSLFLVSQSSSAETERACNRNANTDHRLCVKECDSTRDDELLVCSAGTDEELKKCYLGCSTDRDVCIEPYQDNSRVCNDACFSTYDTAVTACEQNECKQGNIQCQICKLTAKLARFECGKVCKDTFDETKDERQACRKAFRKCLKGCRNSAKVK